MILLAIAARGAFLLSRQRKIVIHDGRARSTQVPFPRIMGIRTYLTEAGIDAHVYAGSGNVLHLVGSFPVDL